MPPALMSLDLGATLGELLRAGARRISAPEAGGRVGPARLPPPGDGAASPTGGDGAGARAEEPEPTADPGGSWWPRGARHVDEGDDDEQPERDELRRRIRMK